MKMKYPKVAQFKDAAAFRARLAELELSLPVDDAALSAAEGSPLAAPLDIGSPACGGSFRVGNRWCIHPMEGWDANRDGSPTDFTVRRWRNFGASGAKLIWGGEAAAVQPDGRANPRQTMAIEENLAGLSLLCETLVAEHASRFGGTDDLLVGLQLTHSGRYARPDGPPAPRIAYHHPLLDAKLGLDPHDDRSLWTDGDLERLVDRFVAAARLAERAGFQFVDVKACHGYLLHEFLSARRRPGPFGGDFEGRTRLLATIVGRIRAELPRLLVGVRLSVFDTAPFATSREVGQPMPYTELLPYDCGFGVDASDPLAIDLDEPIALLRRLKELGVAMVNLSAGSPYYNPHVQRPAIFPPSDGYQPPEDPLVGVVRQIDAARRCKEAVADLPMVGTGYTYLQDYLPHVAQAVVRAGGIDSVGLGRMVLSYPEMPADVLAGRPIARRRVCRTFSECTTAPRSGIESGCYPLDAFYKHSPQAERLWQAKQAGT